MNTKRLTIGRRLFKTAWFWIPMLPLDFIFQFFVWLGESAENGREWINYFYQEISKPKISKPQGMCDEDCCSCPKEYDGLLLKCDHTRKEKARKDEQVEETPTSRYRRDPEYIDDHPSDEQMEYFKRGGR